MRYLLLLLIPLTVYAATTSIKDNILKLGAKDSQDIFIYANNGSATPPFIGFDFSEGKWIQSDDGSATRGFGTELTAKGNLIGFGTATEECILDKTDGKLLTVDSTATCGFDFKDAPVSTTLTTKGDIQTYDTANARLPVGADGSFIVADSNEATGLKWSDSITGLISQAMFVGSLTYQTGSTCIWATNSATYSSFPVDNDCVASNIEGDVAAPNTKIPAIKIINARTDGYYRVEWQGLVFKAIADGSCTATISSTGSYDDQGEVYFAGGEAKQDNHLTGNFKFASGGDKQIEVLARLGSGTGNCEAYGLSGFASKFSVHFFPDSTSLAAVQNKQLTAQTANELSAKIESDGSVSLENYDWINGNCTQPAVGRTRCNLNISLSSEMVCTATPVKGDGFVVGDDSDATISVFSSTTVVETLIEDTGSLSPKNLDIYIHCSKQGADVNTSAVIAGTFENINSSELIQIKYNSDSTQSFPNGANTTPIFEDLNYDNSGGAYNPATGIFTAPRDGEFEVCIANDLDIYASGVGSVIQLNIVSNGLTTVVERKLTYVSISDRDIISGCSSFSMLEGQQLRGDIFQNTGAARIRHANTGYNWITISEKATTESIIKNLNDNNNVECQTKSISSAVTGTGLVPEFQFSNLEAGKKYELTGKIQVSEVTSTANQKEIVYQIKYNGVFKEYFHLPYDFINSTYLRDEASPNIKFISNGSDITFDVTVIANTLLRDGDSFNYLTLCELPDNTILNSTKFN